MRDIQQWPVILFYFDNILTALFQFNLMFLSHSYTFE